MQTHPWRTLRALLWVNYLGAPGGLIVIVLILTHGPMPLWSGLVLLAPVWVSGWWLRTVRCPRNNGLIHRPFQNPFRAMRCQSCGVLETDEQPPGTPGAGIEDRALDALGDRVKPENDASEIFPKTERGSRGLCLHP
jgi:hypothetical protein